MATGPILHVMRNINYAKCLHTNVTTGKHRALYVDFMSVNSMYLIVDANGQHNDYFNKGGKSLENKIIFIEEHG